MSDCEILFIIYLIYYENQCTADSDANSEGLSHFHLACPMRKRGA